jgi:hypothetical protein
MSTALQNCERTALLVYLWDQDERDNTHRLMNHSYDATEHEDIDARDRMFRNYPKNIYKEILDHLDELKFDKQWNEVQYRELVYDEENVMLNEDMCDSSSVHSESGTDGSDTECSVNESLQLHPGLCRFAYI